MAVNSECSATDFRCRYELYLGTGVKYSTRDGPSRKEVFVSFGGLRPFKLPFLALASGASSIQGNQNRQLTLDSGSGLGNDMDDDDSLFESFFPELVGYRSSVRAERSQHGQSTQHLYIWLPHGLSRETSIFDIPITITDLGSQEKVSSSQASTRLLQNECRFTSAEALRVHPSCSLLATSDPEEDTSTVPANAEFLQARVLNVKD